MRTIFCLILLTSFSLQLAAQKSTKTTVDKRLVGLDTALNKVLKDWQVAGFSVAVVEKNKIVYSKGFGYRDYENKLPVTPNTLFAIGSSTKAFTSSLLGMLEKEGKLDFDDLATKHLPELKFFNDEMNNNITLRDMATHRTGLPRHDYSWYLFKTNSRKELLERIKKQEPSAKLRTQFQYNNFMFLLQGMVTEKITGKSWEENLKERIFTPLGMTRTVASIEEMEKDADKSFGYTLRKDSSIKKMDYYTLNSMGPAGSINSSANEVANWLTAWINGGQFNNKEVIPASYVMEAMSSQMVVGANLPGKHSNGILFSNYGLGWFLSSYKNKYRVEHGGNIDGFSASVAFFPGDSLGIVVLVNQNASEVPNIVRNMIADRMLQLPYFNWSAELGKGRKGQLETLNNLKKAAEDSRIKNTQPSHPLQDYTGLYKHEGYGEFELEKRNDSLFANFGAISGYLKHHHYDVFDLRQIDKTEGIDSTGNVMLVRFSSGTNGKIESVSFPIEPTLKPIEFIRKDKAVAVDSSKLSQYLGNYEISGMTIRVYNKGDVLYVFVPGQPDYETVYAGAHKFNLKAIEGFSVEFILENGKVNAMKFIQPNGVFTATKKQ